MTYAGTRAILDADSHVMELDGFLDPFIEPEFRARLRRRGVEALRPVLDEATKLGDARRTDPRKAAEAEERLLRDKGWHGGGSSGWSTSRLGYLDQRMFGYALARFASTRGEERPAWLGHVRPDVRAPLKQGLKFIATL